jgi:oligopeptide transport system substrate-binding protein
MQPRVLIFLLFYLCPLPGISQAKPAEENIRVRLSSSPQTLDWTQATSGSEGAILENLMSGLFKLNSDRQAIPDLARSFKWSPDRKTLEVTLRTDFTWTDGEKLNSRQFLDSFERLLNPNLNSQNASLLFGVAGARDYFLGKAKSFESVGIKAPAGDLLVFHLNEPRSRFLNILTHWSTFPYRKDRPSATLGPYALLNRSPTKLLLRARSKTNPIQQAAFEVIRDGAEAVDRFRKGQLDYLLQIEDALLTPDTRRSLPPLTYATPLRVVAMLHLNPNRVATNTPEKRKTIMQQIHPESLIALQPESRAPAEGLIPDQTRQKPRLQSKSPEAGSDALLVLGYPDDSYSKTLAEQIQKTATRIKLRLEPLPKGDLSSASQKYDLVLTLFGLDYGDPDQLLSSFLSQGTHDLFKVNSGELLRMLTHARSTEAIQAQELEYREAERYLEEKIAIVMPLFYRKRPCLIRSRFQFTEGRSGSAKLVEIKKTFP